MPQKYKPMNEHLLLYTLVYSGRYRVDIETGQVFSGETEVQQYFAPENIDPNKKHPCVRIHFSGCRIGIPICKAVWMVSRKSVVPDGFEVHHLDENSTNNHWENLVALFNEDHRHMHRLLKVADDF